MKKEFNPKNVTLEICGQKITGFDGESAFVYQPIVDTEFKNIGFVDKQVSENEFLIKITDQETIEKLKEHQRKFEWQPIETAPNDERILLSDGKVQFCGRWLSDSEIEDMMFDDDLEKGWYEENLYHDLYERYFFIGCTPTHWMPLPPAPEE